MRGEEPCEQLTPVIRLLLHLIVSLHSPPGVLHLVGPVALAVVQNFGIRWRFGYQFEQQQKHITVAAQNVCFPFCRRLKSGFPPKVCRLPVLPSYVPVTNVACSSILIHLIAVGATAGEALIFTPRGSSSSRLCHVKDNPHATRNLDTCGKKDAGIHFFEHVRFCHQKTR